MEGSSIDKGWSISERFQNPK